MKISDSKYVVLSYDLNVGEDDERVIMEQATTEHPLKFIYGTNMMLQEFEAHLEGLQKGDTFKFSLSPEEAYGDFDESRVIDLPINIFEVDGKVNQELLVVGNTLPMMDTDGNRLMGAVVEVGEESVTMDFNHPLSGETLHFEGKVEEVRDSTAEDIATLSSGSNCDGCDCGDEHVNQSNCGGCC